MTDLIELARRWKVCKNFQWVFGMVAALAGVSMTACVEQQQPSIVVTGSIIGEYDAETGSCSYDAPQISTWGRINLRDLIAYGQPMAAGFSYEAPGTFFFTAMYENSTQSDVMITSATVSFPVSSNTFYNYGAGIFTTQSGNEVEWERPLSMLVPSGGGPVISRIPLINGVREAEDFKAFLAQAPTNKSLTFIAEIQFKGKTLSGEKVKFNHLECPIKIYADCACRTTPLCAL